MIKFVFGIPAYRGQVHYGHVMQMQSMAAAVLVSRGQFALRNAFFPESCSVDWSRNMLLHLSLKDEADWLLMCDADTFHRNAAEILRMLETGKEKGAAVIASPVRMRNRKGYNVFDREGGEVRETPDEWLGKVIEVDRIGTAMMGIHCHWIREHFPEQPWFQTQHLSGPQPSKIGEDVTFCDRVKDRGGLVLADGRFEPVHVG